MARRPRIKIQSRAAAYHVVSRVNNKDFRLDTHMKQAFINILQKISYLFDARYAAWSAMDNHTHLMVVLRDREELDPEEAIQRWNRYHEKEYRLNPNVEEYREYVANALTDISRFMKKLNLLLTNAYNRHTGAVGTLWQSRFHSTIFERGISLLRGAAYIELNSFRASLEKRPEDYEYSSLHHLKQGNPGGLVDIDLLEEGLCMSELHKDLTDTKALTHELYKTYLAYIYEAGSTPKGGKEHGIIITDEMKARLQKYGIEGERGSLLQRTWEYSKSIFVGGSDYAKRFYDDHINPGYTGKQREEHIQKWLHTSGKNLWSVFSVFHQGLPEGQRRRLPSRDGP